MIRSLRELAPASRKSLFRLFLAGLLFWASISTLLPTLPLYISTLGGNLQEVGLVVGAFAIGLLCFRPWLGQSADRQGRKAVLLVGLWVTTTAPLGYLLMRSLPLLMAWRTYHGLSVAAFTIAYLAWVVDLTPPRIRGEILGYMTLVNPIGLSVGPAMGGFILESFGYPTLFCTSSVLGAIGFALASTASEERPQERPEERPQDLQQKTLNPQKRSLRNNWFQSFILPLTAQVLVIGLAVGIIPLGVSYLGLSHYLIYFFSPFYLLAAILGLNLQPGSRVWQPEVRVITVCLLLLGLAFGTVTTFIALFIKDQGLEFNPGWFYTAAALSSFAGRLIVGRHSDRYGRGVFISLSFLLYTLAMLQLARSTTLVDFLLGGSLEGAGFGILISIVAAFVADRSLPDERGRVFSICLAGLDVGIAMAGPILGYLADQIGYTSTFRIGASLSSVALLIFVLGANKTIGSSLRFSLGLTGDEYSRQN